MIVIIQPPSTHSHFEHFVFFSRFWQG